MSTEPNDGGPAYPCELTKRIGKFAVDRAYPGMTLRDYLAANAPSVPEWFQRKEWKTQDIVPAPDMGKGYVRHGFVHHVELGVEHLTRWRYAYADAMLKARQSQPAP